MQKTLAIVMLAIVPTLMLAQETKSVIRPRLEIASVEKDEGIEEVEVFRMGDNGRYFLSVGHLGMGWRCDTHAVANRYGIYGGMGIDIVSIVNQ